MVVKFSRPFTVKVSTKVGPSNNCGLFLVPNFRTTVLVFCLLKILKKSTKGGLISESFSLSLVPIYEKRVTNHWPTGLSKTTFTRRGR